MMNLLASNRFEYHYYSFFDSMVYVSFDKKATLEAGGNSTLCRRAAPGGRVGPRK